MWFIHDAYVKRDHNELLMWFIESLDARQGVSYSVSVVQVKILTHQANSSRHCDEQDRLITRTCTRFQQSRVNKGVGRKSSNGVLTISLCWGDSVMNSPQMKTQANFSCKLLAANVAVVSGPISVMNSSQMQIQAA